MDAQDPPVVETPVLEAPEPAAPRKDYSGPALAIVFLLCSGFYVWTANTFGLPWMGHDGRPYFARLAEAFVHHQTSLLTQPLPEMFTLRNPYDPRENDPYRLQDALFYHGKYYFYWGVSPTLLWYLPVRFLTGLSGYDVAACSIFAIAGLLFNFLLFYSVRRDFYPESSIVSAVLLALLLAFGNVVPFVLRRPIFYEAAILCGYMLTAAFLYFAYEAAFRGELKPGYLFASGVALALTFLCRPFLAACGVATVAGLWLYRRPESRPGWSAVRLLALALGPGAAAVAAQAWYNFVRFDSPFDFGLKYQVGSLAPSEFLSLHRIPFGILTYLFTLPKSTPFFPFIKATNDPSSQPLDLFAKILTKHADAYPGAEALVGFVFCVPLLVLYVLAPFFFKDRKTDPVLRVFTLATLGGALAVFLIDLTFYYSTMRYEVDFLPGLLFPIAIFGLWLDRRTRLFPMILAAPVIYTVLVSFFLSVTGANDGLFYNSPGQFNFLTKIFSPIEKRLAGPEWMTFGGVRAKIAPPKCPSELLEPLVATGIPGEGDVFSFECDGHGELSVVWDHHWTGRRTVGNPFPISGQPMEIEIEAPPLYPRLPAIAEMVYYPGIWDRIPKSCVVRVNGAEVFRKDPCEMDKSTSKTVYLFSNGIGIPGVADRYSGQVLSVERTPPK